MGFDTVNQRLFMVDVLPEASGALTRFDGEHILGIYPEMAIAVSMSAVAVIAFSTSAEQYLLRGMEAEADIAFSASAVQTRTRGMEAEADIAFSASMVITIPVFMQAEADIEFTTFMTIGIDGNTGLIAGY